MTAVGGPPDLQQNVPVEAFIDREFTRALSGFTLTPSTVSLKANTGNVQDGAPTGAALCTMIKQYATSGGMEKIVCEHANLETSTWYTITYTTGIKTGTGLALPSNVSYQFKTSSFAGGGNFIRPPVIVGSVPRPGSILPTNARIRVYFSPGGTGTGSTMRTGTSSGSVQLPTNVQIFATSNGQPTGNNLLACSTVGANPASPTDCNMAWHQSGATLTITPGKKSPAASQDSTGGTALTSGNSYVLIVRGPQGGFGGTGGARNTDDMPLMGADYFVPFTATGSDAFGPTVKASFPENGATSVDRAMYNIGVAFTEAVDESSVTETSMKLYEAGVNTVCNGGGDDDVQLTNTIVDYSESENIAYISPNGLLTASTVHCLVVTTNIKDIAGNTFDGDRSTGGNQNKTLSFTTGVLVNGAAAPDTAQPKVDYANADNFSIAVTFSEPMQFDAVAIGAGRSSSDPFVVNNINNWTLESPPGVPVNLVGKFIDYFPSKLTAVIEGLALPPNQEFKAKIATGTGAVKVKDLAGNIVDSTGTPAKNEAKGQVQSSMDTGGRLGPGEGGGEFDFFTNGTSPTMVMPMTPMAGATSNYRIEITPAKSIPSGGTIVFTFPSGFSTDATCATALTGPPENADLNGPATGTVTIASIACNNTSRAITVTTGGAQTGTGARVSLILQGIVNSPLPKLPSEGGGYMVDIKTKNTSSDILESKTSMPFPLMQPGSLGIQGTVFQDNGAGGGTANDKIKNGSEAGVRALRVCIEGPMGFNCANTTSTGAYAFNLLGNGFYRILLPAIQTGSLVVSGSPYREINLSSTQTSINFPLSVVTTSVRVDISGIPANTNLDVFAFNTSGPDAGNTVKNLPYTGASAGISLPAAAGTWRVGVGPEMPKDPTQMGRTVTSVNFAIPTPKEVLVPISGSAAVAFSLQSASFQIKGKVIDGSGSAISNAFIMARPANIASQGGDAMAMSQSNGTFILQTGSGTYAVQSMSPGMPPSTPVSVLVKANVSNADNNLTADVNGPGGTLITNAGLKGSAVNLELILDKGGVSIAGSVLDENGNTVNNAFVQAKKLSGGSFNGEFFGSPTTNGAFTLYVDTNATYKLTAHAPGYGELGSKTVSVTTTSVTGQNIQASAGDFGTITGTVTQNSVAVQGAFINAFSDTGGNHTVSGTDGTYTMKVKTGTYTIEGFRPGTGPTSRLTGIVVSAGATASSQDLTIGQTGTVRVAIANAPDNTFVRVDNTSGRGDSTSTNSGGTFNLTLPAGSYTVTAQSPSSGVIGSTSATVTAGAVTNVTLTPPTSYTIAGSVTSSSSTCKDGVAVAFADKTNGRMIGTTTAVDGSFSVSLPNGSYRFSSGKPGCIDAEAPATVTVAGAAQTGLSRTLTAADATITGRVTLSGTGITIPTKVMAQTSDGRFVFTDVDTSASGGADNYSLDVPAGTTWSITARSDGYSAAAVTAVAGASDADLTLTAISGYTRKEPQSTSITPNVGGEFTDPNIGSTFKLNIPAGALGSSTTSNTVTTAPTTAIVTETPTVLIVGTSGIKITATDGNGNEVSTLNDDAEITIPYTDADVTAAGVSETQLQVYVWNESTAQFDALPSTVNTDTNTITAVSPHFSTFAVGSANGSSASSGSSGTSGGGTSGGGGGGGGGGGRRGAPGRGGDASAYAGRVTMRHAAPAEVIPDKALRSVRMRLRLLVEGKEIVFRDIPSDAWFASSVATVINAGIASGYRNSEGNLTGEYGPANNITAAEIAKMTFEAGRIPIDHSIIPENRSARDHWANGYIAEAEKMKISTYRPKGLANVNHFSTRGEVAQTLVEILGITEPREEEEVTATDATAATGSGMMTGSGTVATGSGTTTSGSGALATASGTVLKAAAPEAVPAAPERVLQTVRFTDVGKKHKHAAAIALLAGYGIVSGDTDRDGKPTGTFRPNDPINRAEIAKIFTKLIEIGVVR